MRLLWPTFAVVSTALHAGPLRIVGPLRSSTVRLAENAATPAVVETPAAPPEGFEWADQVKGVVRPVHSAPRTLSLEQEVDELYETLELYDERLLELSTLVDRNRMDAEVAVQKTGAFWLDRLASAQSSSTAEADAKVAAAEAKAAEAEARAADAEARVAAAEAESKRLAEALPQLRELLDSLAVAPATPTAKPEATTPKKETPPKADETKAKADAKEDEAAATKAAKAGAAAKAKAAVKEVKKEEAKPKKEDAPKAVVEAVKTLAKTEKKEAAKKAEAKVEKKKKEVKAEKEKEVKAEVKEEAVKADAVESLDAAIVQSEGVVLITQDQWPEDGEHSLTNFEVGYKERSANELRSKLSSLDMPTLGTRAELMTRYEEALRRLRNKHMSWDAESQSWVEIQPGWTHFSPNYSGLPGFRPPGLPPATA